MCSRSRTRRKTSATPCQPFGILAGPALPSCNESRARDTHPKKSDHDCNAELYPPLRKQHEEAGPGATVLNSSHGHSSIIAGSQELQRTQTSTIAESSGTTFQMFLILLSFCLASVPAHQIWFVVPKAAGDADVACCPHAPLADRRPLAHVVLHTSHFPWGRFGLRLPAFECRWDDDGSSGS